MLTPKQLKLFKFLKHYKTQNEIMEFEPTILSAIPDHSKHDGYNADWWEEWNEQQAIKNEANENQENKEILNLIRARMNIL